MYLVTFYNFRRDSNATSNTGANLTTSASNSELHRHKGRSQSFSGSKEEVRRKKIQRRETEMKISNNPDPSSTAAKSATAEWPSRR